MIIKYLFYAASGVPQAADNILAQYKMKYEAHPNELLKHCRCRFLKDISFLLPFLSVPHMLPFWPPRILQGQKAVLQDGAVQHRVQVQQVEVQKKLSPKVRHVWRGQVRCFCDRSTGWHMHSVKTFHWLRFGMFCHTTRAIGSHSSGPPSAGAIGTKSMGGFHHLDGSHCRLSLKLL